MFCMVVNGSGNPIGHCKHIADAVSKVVSEAGWEVSVVNVRDIPAAHCTDCGGCRPSGRCVIDDGMRKCYADFSRADLVVFVSPIQFSGPASLTKLFMDRLNCFWLDSPGQERRVSCVFTGGSPEPKFSNAVSEFKALTLGTGSRWAGHLEIPAVDGSTPAVSAAKAAEFVRGLI